MNLFYIDVMSDIKSIKTLKEVCNAQMTKRFMMEVFILILCIPFSYKDAGFCDLSDCC